jgi:hypothetical protein
VADSGPDWLNATAGAVHRASDIVQAQDELKVISDVARELNQVLDEFEPLAAAANVGRGSWWSGLPTPARLREVLGQAEDDLDRRDLAAVLQELKPFAAKARNSVRTAWKDYVESQIGNAAELQELVDALASGGNLSVAGNLKQALGGLPALKRQLPDAVAVERLDETVALAEAFETALPDAVKAFVSATVQGGAPIAALNTEVLAWLEKNDAFDNFKVVAGKPTGASRG